MKVYISGRMTGLPEWNFPAFHAAAAAWREAGWEVVNPAEAFSGDTTRKYVDYVMHDLDVLKTCDAIAMLPGWDDKDARGSVWEWGVANAMLHLLVFDAREPIDVRDGPRKLTRNGRPKGKQLSLF